MTFATSKLLYKNLQSCLYVASRNSGGGGSIKDAGGKWAEMQAAHEGEYFYKKNKEMLEYIKEEIKKGRHIEDIIEETKQELARKSKAKNEGYHEDDYNEHP